MNTGSNGYKGPLDGLKVIDWTMWQFGPISTVMLADMGAEVIKVESLDGDHGRQFGQIMGINTELADGVNAYFESMNRQKLGIALDLKNPRGLKILHKLVAESDIFVENFRKGVAERLGLGYEDLLKHNEKIIYASASGYGPKGPDSAISPPWSWRLRQGQVRCGGLAQTTGCLIPRAWPIRLAASCSLMGS